MFSVKKINEQGFNKIVLSDDERTVVEVLPEWGAMLHSFKIITADKKNIDIIESYDNANDISQNLTAKGFRSSKLSPFVCRLKKGMYNFNSKEYKINKFSFDGKNAIHGLLYDKAFEVERMNSDEVMATATMIYKYRGQEEGYPFHYDCRVTYTLEKENQLSVATEVVNQTNGIIPIQDGWHPYFNLGKTINELQFQFNSKAIVEFDDELIPTGKLLPYDEFNKGKKIGDTFLDNCFALNLEKGQPACVLHNETDKIQLEIYAEENYPYLQIYTPPHRNSIAIENLSSMPDAFNNKMDNVELSAKDSISFKLRLKVTTR